MWKFFLLSLITFGIYGIVVMSKISVEINRISSPRDGKHTMHYCLICFVFSWLTMGIVPLVWQHRLTNRIGDELRAKVEESARQIETLPDSLKSAFLELAAELEPQAGVVYELSRDSVVVDFDILVPDEIEPMRNSVLVVRNSETGAWSVEEIR